MKQLGEASLIRCEIYSDVNKDFSHKDHDGDEDLQSNDRNKDKDWLGKLDVSVGVQ